MNHFLTIWTKPNETLRDMIDNKSIGYGILIIILSSLGSSVFVFEGSGILDNFSLPVILLISIFLMSIFTVIAYIFNALIYWLIGKMLGGKGRYGRVCLATASGSLPMIGIVPFSILAVILYGKGLYVELADPMAQTNMSLGFYMLYVVVMMGLSIYGIVILSKALGYAHGFSALRGFGAVMIYAAVMFVISLAVIMFVIMVVFALFGLGT